MTLATMPNKKTALRPIRLNNEGSHISWAWKKALEDHAKPEIAARVGKGMLACAFNAWQAPTVAVWV